MRTGSSFAGTVPGRATPPRVRTTPELACFSVPPLAVAGGSDDRQTSPEDPPTSGPIGFAPARREASGPFAFGHAVAVHEPAHTAERVADLDPLPARDARLTLGAAAPRERSTRRGSARRRRRSRRLFPRAPGCAGTGLRTRALGRCFSDVLDAHLALADEAARLAGGGIGLVLVLGAGQGGELANAVGAAQRDTASESTPRDCSQASASFVHPPTSSR